MSQGQAEVLKRADDPPIVTLFKEYKPDIEAALPEGWTSDRFFVVVTNQIRETPKLRECVPLTVVTSAMLAAQLALEPGRALGECWIIPRRNQGRWEASFQMGYKGLRQLAYRSGQVSIIEARIVFEGDDFDYQHGLGGSTWRHRPSDEVTDTWTHVYAVARTVMGAEPLEVMSRKQVLAHRDRYVPQWDKGGSAWKDHEPEQARKTVTARLARQLPMSVEFRSALAVDGATPYALVPDLAGLVALERGDEEVEGDDAEE